MHETLPLQHLAAKLSAIMAEVGHIAPDRTTQSGPKFSYVSEKAITARVQPLMAKHGLVILPTATEIIATRVDTTDNGKNEHNVRVRVTYRVIETESGEWIDVQMLGEGEDARDRGIVKACTAAWKTLLRQVFAIPTEGDDEATGSQRGKRRDAQPYDRGETQGERREPPARPRTDQPATGAVNPEVLASTKAECARLFPSVEDPFAHACRTIARMDPANVSSVLPAFNAFVERLTDYAAKQGGA